MLVITLAVAFTLGLKTLFSLYLCFVYTCSHVPFFFFFFKLSKVNSSTLLVWLKQRGVLVGTRPKKEELTLKVMGCLAES